MEKDEIFCGVRICPFGAETAQSLVYPMVLGILGFCDAKDSRSVLKQVKNTISFQVYKYLAMPMFSGGGVNVYFVLI